MKRNILASLLLSFTLGCSIHTQSPVQPVAYDYTDRDFYDRGYAPSPSQAASSSVLGESTTFYRLEYQEGSQWVVQGTYPTEAHALQDLVIRGGKKKKLWRLVLNESNNELVIGIFKT